MAEEEKSLTATDSKGRVLTIRKLDIGRELDLIEAAGPLSENRRWMMMATIAATVTAIDGVPLFFPSNKKTIRDHVVKVGSEGVSAAVRVLASEIPDEAVAEFGDAEAATAGK